MSSAVPLLKSEPVYLRNRLFALIHLLRLEQWSKNAFVLAGLVFRRAWTDTHLSLHVGAAVLGFSLVASGTYIINDFVDRDLDRKHEKKSKRPLAAGTVSLPEALICCLLLLSTGEAVGFAASPAVAGILGIYVILTLAYSLWLKRLVLVDVFVLAGLYMLRLFAGTSGVGISPSGWLITCGGTFSLFLALGKRRAELRASMKPAAEFRPVLGSYTVSFLDRAMSIAAACAIIMYSLYTMSPETVHLHATGRLIYTTPFVMFGVFRYMLLSEHLGTGSDPARELFVDWPLMACAGAWLAAVMLFV
jgi:4-hydroxybenzoate polyprenyltransferase